MDHQFTRDITLFCLLVMITNVSTASQDTPDVPPASETGNQISGLVWLDNNADGLQNPGEPGFIQATLDFSPPTVALYPVNSLDPVHVVSLSEKADGRYVFNNVSAGDYYVCVSNEFQEMGLSVTTPDNVDDSIDSDFDFSPCSYEIVVDSNQSIVRDLGLKGGRHVNSSFAKLADTGILFGGDYPNGNNSSCTGTVINQQDCALGRDAQALAGTLRKIGTGHAGFDFTKLNTDGNPLQAGAASWSCVRDNYTGLVWEAKTDNEGIHNKGNTYRWGGMTAQAQSYGRHYHDWDVLVQETNQQRLCGMTGWRVPSVNELESLINFNSVDPAIDQKYFPHASSDIWTSTPDPVFANKAWHVSFANGFITHDDRNHQWQVRLVNVIAR
jgi:hypothetical protein